MASYEVVMGEGTGRRRDEEYLDGRLTIRSAYGLRNAERALLEVLPRDKTGAMLIINSQYAVLAYALRILNPDAEIYCHYDDAWDYDRAVATLQQNPLEKVKTEVAPDPPAGPWNYILMPLEKQGVADLVRERIRRAAAEWLAPQGLLLTSSDTKDDRFIRDEVKKAFGALHAAAEKQRKGGVGYVARRPAKELVGSPRSWVQFEVQEGDQSLTFHNRLGVFCSDRLDGGARALLAMAELDGVQRILDLGSGNGVVGIIAGLRQPQAHLTFLDSYARAVEATRRNVEEHGLASRTDDIILSANPPEALAKSKAFDCVLTNPPYYGNWRIAELFLETIRQSLAPGGRLFLVTRGPEWYRSRLPEYDDLREEIRGGYTVIKAVRR